MTRRFIWFIAVPQDGRDHFVRANGAGDLVLYVPDLFDATSFGTRDCALAWAEARFDDFTLHQKAVH